MGVNCENIYEEEIQVERVVDVKTLMWKNAVLGVYKGMQGGFSDWIKMNKEKSNK